MVSGYFTIYKKEVAGVVEIANEIGYTHPSTINLLKELEKKKADTMGKR